MDDLGYKYGTALKTIVVTFYRSKSTTISSNISMPGERDASNSNKKTVRCRCRFLDAACGNSRRNLSI